MTIDEAIAHAREVAEKNRNFDVIPEKVMATSTFKYNCLKCAEEHEQLAEWLEELKKYREIGLTQYMIKDLIKSEMQAHKDAVHNAELLDEYEEIGTIEECREAVEKQKAVKPLYRHYEDKGNPSYIKITCPNGCNIQLYPVTDKHFAHEHVYCPKCGQKIDWSDEE